MVTIKVKKVRESAKIPTKAHDSDACYDLYLDAPQTGEAGVMLFPKETIKLPSGIKTEIPAGYFAAVFPRSGLGINKNIRLANGTGIIDCDYRGEWVIALTNDSEFTWILKHGDRVAQFAILPVIESTLVEADELSDTERGEGGLGSTGN